MRYDIAELTKHWNNRLAPETLDIIKLYVRTRLCIIMNLDMTAFGDVSDASEFAGGAEDGNGPSLGIAVWPKDSQAGFGDSQNGG